MMESVILKKKMEFMDEEVKRRGMCSKMLEYYLIKNSYDYGVKVVKKHDNKKNFYEECFYVENIGDYNKAKSIIELFARNKVTPIAADEVLEDLFKQENLSN